MQKYYVVLTFAVFMFFTNQANSMVGDHSKDYCNPFFSGIQTIYVDYHSGLPDTDNIDWESALGSLYKYFGETLSDEKIELIILDKKKDKEEILNDEGSILIRFYYSYADGDSFSVPTKNGVLQVWYNIFRTANGVYQKRDIGAEYRMYFKKKEKNNIAHDISGPSVKLFSNAVCDVLFSTAGKKCTSASDWPHSELIDKQCDLLTEEEKEKYQEINKELYQLYEQ